LPERIVAKEQYRQKCHSEYNDHGRSVKLSFCRPRNLGHFRFDGDEEIGEAGPVDQSVSKPHSEGDEAQG
jgi:hypothetical protein